MAPKKSKQPVESSSSDDSSSSESSSSSSSSSSEEQTKKVTKKAAPVSTKKSKKVESSSDESSDDSSDESSSDSSSDDSSSDEEPKSKKGSKASKDDSDDSSDDDSSDDSSDDDSSDDSSDDSEDDSKSKKRVAPASKSSSEDSVGTKKQRVAPTLKTTHRVIVDGLPASVTDETLRDTFSACGTVEIASVAYDKSGKSRGFGIVGYAEPAGASGAVQMNGVWKIDGSDIVIIQASAGASSGPSTPYTPRGSSSSYGAGARSPAAPREQGAPSKTLFIKNLAFSLDENALKEAFTEFGTVVGVRMPLNEEGRYKGIGYIEFEDVESATAAMDKCQGQPLNGREIFLDFAQERSQSDRGSFGGTPRGRGNGFGGGRGAPRGGRGTPRGGRGASRGAPAFEGKRMTFDD